MKGLILMLNDHWLGDKTARRRWYLIGPGLCLDHLSTPGPLPSSAREELLLPLTLKNVWTSLQVHFLSQHLCPRCSREESPLSLLDLSFLPHGIGPPPSEASISGGQSLRGPPWWAVKPDGSGFQFWFCHYVTVRPLGLGFLISKMGMTGVPGWLSE